ncbi:MAG: hypothetical protein KKD44_27130 [Proteobacteria bacterium]|nr:hypothetical protein [Pseudomonadota bacterium]
MFLLFGFVTVINGQQLYDAVMVIWEQAKVVAISFVITLFSVCVFTWGMGWTLNDKERAKMKQYRKEQKEKKKREIELDRKRQLLLKKHGLEEKKSKKR